MVEEWLLHNNGWVQGIVSVPLYIPFDYILLFWVAFIFVQVHAQKQIKQMNQIN